MVVAIVVIAPSPAGAAGRHCSVTVTGQKKSGELITTPMVCGPSMQTAFLSVIAIHYVDLNFSGATLSIQGGPCNGGWLNLPAGWDDTISSTWSGCSSQHYDVDNLGGAVETLPPGGGNLTALHDRANSVRYT
jgi:hypothetical protein